MEHDLVQPPKARRGEHIAVVSPSFAAAGAFPAVHEQAMRRLTEVTGLIPVEYPTTRLVGATAEERAADINAALADPAICAVLAVIGGEDQITVIPHLDAELPARGVRPAGHGGGAWPVLDSDSPAHRLRAADHGTTTAHSPG